jgi:hypothetical protein
MITDLSVGDIVEREDGLDWTVKEVAGDRVVFVNEAGETETVEKPQVEDTPPIVEKFKPWKPSDGSGPGKKGLVTDKTEKARVKKNRALDKAKKVKEDVEIDDVLSIDNEDWIVREIDGDTVIAENEAGELTELSADKIRKYEKGAVANMTGAKPKMKNRVKGTLNAAMKLHGGAKVPARESVEDELKVDDVVTFDDQEFTVRQIDGDRVIAEDADGQTVEFSMNDIEEDSTALETLHPNSRPADDPKSRIDMITKVLGNLGRLPDHKLVTWFDQTMAQFGHYGDGVKDFSAHNKDSVKMHPSDARESVENLFTGEGFTDDFRERATTLFEAALQDRLLSEVAELEEAYAARLEEEVGELTGEVTERVESYLDYIAETWMEENEVAVENALRSEITEEFIDGLRTLFEDHYIDVPEDRVDAFEALAERVEELETALDETLVECARLRDASLDEELGEVFELVSDGLPKTQVEKLAQLAEGIDHGNDPEAFGRKLQIIRESYFNDDGSVKVGKSTGIESETFEGELTEGTVHVDPSVKRYVQAIDRTARG